MDNTSYFGGSKIPLEIQRVLPILPFLNPKAVQKVISLVIVYLTGEGNSQYNPQLVEEFKGSQLQQTTDQLIQHLDTELDGIIQQKLTKKPQIENAKIVQQNGLFSCLFTAFFMIIRTAIRLKLDEDKFKLTLEQMKLDSGTAKIVLDFYEKKYEKIVKQSLDSSSWFNKIIDVKWRLDVAISTSLMTRVFKPVLQMQWTLSNGQIKTFELPLKQFHNLRMSVATILNDMNTLENNKIMKIIEK